MIRKLSIQVSLTAALALAAGLAAASGSDGGASAEVGDAALYNMGKSVYATKMACSACPMAGKGLDATMARELVAKKPPASLSAEESAAMNVYLKRRFKL